MKGRTVVITGASSGIGKEMAITFSALGANIVLCSRNVDQIESFRHQLPSPHLVLRTDVTDPTSVQDAFAAIGHTFGSIDFLVNNAGFVLPQGLLDIDFATWNRTMSVNLTGTFLCTQQAVLLMKQKGGKIINISSTAGLTPRPGWSAYAASKSAVIGFSEAIAEELKNYGIKVFIICPGRTATPLRKVLAPQEDPTTIMQPSSVVDVVRFCFTDAADVLEGQPIQVRQRF